MSIENKTIDVIAEGFYDLKAMIVSEIDSLFDGEHLTESVIKDLEAIKFLQESSRRGSGYAAYIKDGRILYLKENWREAKLLGVELQIKNLVPNRDWAEGRLLNIRKAALSITAPKEIDYRSFASIMISILSDSGEAIGREPIDLVNAERYFKIKKSHLDALGNLPNKLSEVSHDLDGASSREFGTILDLIKIDPDRSMVLGSVYTEPLFQKASDCANALYRVGGLAEFIEANRSDESKSDEIKTIETILDYLEVTR